MPPIDQRHGRRSTCQPMHQHRALVEDTHAIEGEDFLHAFLIHSFRNMENEWQIGRAFREPARQLWLE
jgi:hypothetical protein